MLIAGLLLSACSSSDPAGDTAQSGGGGAVPVPVAPESGGIGSGVARAEWIDDRLSVDVPISIVTIGYDTAQIAALQTALQPHAVIHNVSDLNQSLPPDIDEAQEQQDYTLLLPLMGETTTSPVMPTAIYQIQAAPAGLVAGFERTLSEAKLSETLYEANMVEDFLAAALPQYGFPTNPNAPSLVLVHLAAFGVGEHGWRITGTSGVLEPVRLFGSRQPLLVLDPSAVPDPYAGSDGPAYRSPLAPDATADIAEYILALTEYRILQANVLPQSTKPCHAVTGIMAIRETSLGQNAPFLRPVEETLVQENLKRAFDNLTDTDTYFDLKLLYLPADDPVLDVLLRPEFSGMEVLRGYLSLNYDKYHVAHEGCERYLSVVAQSDLVAVPSGVLGIGTYDDSPGHRISMSWVHDAFRLLFDPESPVGVYAEDGLEYLNWWEYLFSHETGHLFGQRHPHDITSDSYEEESVSLGNNSFSSIWSSMSYQQDGRMIDFGYIDRNNWKRVRAGYALREAAAAGREGTPEWNKAMERASRLDWTGVWEVLSQ